MDFVSAKYRNFRQGVAPPDRTMLELLPAVRGVRGLSANSEQAAALTQTLSLLKKRGEGAQAQCTPSRCAVSFTRSTSMRPLVTSISLMQQGDWASRR